VYDCRYDAVSVSDAAGSVVPTARRVLVVQWRIGKGHWRKMGLHWNNKTNGSLPLWNSGTLSLGTIPARGTVTTEINGFEYWPW